MEILPSWSVFTLVYIHIQDSLTCILKICTFQCMSIIYQFLKPLDSFNGCLEAAKKIWFVNSNAGELKISNISKHREKIKRMKKQSERHVGHC